MHVYEFTCRASTLSGSANIDLNMPYLRMIYLLHGGSMFSKTEFTNSGSHTVN